MYGPYGQGWQKKLTDTQMGQSFVSVVLIREHNFSFKVLKNKACIFIVGREKTIKTQDPVSAPILQYLQYNGWKKILNNVF